MVTKRVAVIADSAAGLPPEVAADHGIRIIPLRLVWGSEVLRDGVDITPSEFYARLGRDNHLPTTSTFCTEELVKLCRQLAEDHEAIVSVLLANELSGSAATAQLAQRLHPELPLHVVDSRTAAAAEGLVALAAARAAASGAGVDEVIRCAHEVIDRVHLIFALDTLEYLHRGGRIGAASAFLGSLIDMKPIVSIPPGTGSVVGIARPRTWDRALQRLLALMADRVGNLPVHVTVAHGARQEAAMKLADAIARRFDVRELYVAHFTPVMAAHSGPTLGMGFYTE